MEKIRKAVADIKESFAEVDNAIASYKAQKKELEAKITASEGEYSLKAVASTALSKTKLTQINEALSIAENKRAEMAKEVWHNNSSIRNLARKCVDELKAEKYGTQIIEIWDKTTELRKLIFETYQEGSRDVSEISDMLDSLRHYNGDRHLTDHLHMKILPILESGINAEIIDFILNTARFGGFDEFSDTERNK